MGNEEEAKGGKQGGNCSDIRIIGITG